MDKEQIMAEIGELINRMAIHQDNSSLYPFEDRLDVIASDAEQITTNIRQYYTDRDN